MAGIQILPVHLAAFDRQFGLLVDRGSHFGGSHGGKARFGNFIAIPARFAAEQVERRPIFWRKRAQSESRIFFNELGGIALRAHDHLGKGMVPHLPQAAPTDSHTIVLACGKITTGEQKPARLPYSKRAGDNFSSVDRLAVHIGPYRRFYRSIVSEFYDIAGALTPAIS